MENASVVTSVTLTAYYEMEDLKYVYFVIFLLLYIITVVLNCIVIIVICVDRALHEPMYIFVCNLAINGLYGSTALLPPLLSNLLSHSHRVSLSCCHAQIFCLHTYVTAEFVILGVMGYDRYVAICHPLQYHSIMSLSKVYQLIAVPWLYSVVVFTALFVVTAQLMLCEENIDKLYCTNHLLIKHSCTDTSVINIVGLVSVFVINIPLIILLLYSYSHIIKICLLSSRESKNKALKTCMPHLISLINFSCGGFFEICQSRLKMNNVHYGVRLFMSLYFLTFPPVVNPALYGMTLHSIRIQIFRLFTDKHRSSPRSQKLTPK